MRRMWMLAALAGVMGASTSAEAQDGPRTQSEMILAAAPDSSVTRKSQGIGSLTEAAANSAVESPNAGSQEDASHEARIRRALALLYLTLGSGCKDSVCPVGQAR